jgi:hypothetical protein
MAGLVEPRSASGMARPSLSGKWSLATARKPARAVPFKRPLLQHSHGAQSTQEEGICAVGNVVMWPAQTRLDARILDRIGERKPDQAEERDAVTAIRARRTHAATDLPGALDGALPRRPT